MRPVMYTCSVLGTVAVGTYCAQMSVHEGLGNIPLNEMTGKSVFIRHYPSPPPTMSVIYIASVGS